MPSKRLAVYKQVPTATATHVTQMELADIPVLSLRKMQVTGSNDTKISRSKILLWMSAAA
jgi:hypothetical protein